MMSIVVDGDVRCDVVVMDENVCQIRRNVFRNKQVKKAFKISHKIIRV